MRMNRMSMSPAVNKGQMGAGCPGGENASPALFGTPNNAGGEGKEDDGKSKDSPTLLGDVRRRLVPL